MPQARSRGLSRRDLLAGTAAIGLAAIGAHASAMSIRGIPAWNPGTASPPQPVQPGPWKFFTPEEATTVEALVDRLIPPDPQWPGGKDAGCAVFIDRQLAGPYGNCAAFTCVRHSSTGPATRAAIATHTGDALPAIACRARSLLPRPVRRQGPRRGAGGSAGRSSLGWRRVRYSSTRRIRTRLFRTVVTEYTGRFLRRSGLWRNKGLAAWKMIGFPGARYDYRDWVERHNERYPLPPVGIGGRPEWTTHRS